MYGMSSYDFIFAIDFPIDSGVSHFSRQNIGIKKASLM